MRTNSSGATDVDIPVCRERLDGCLASARRWTSDLPRFADSCQSKADRWAITAGVLAALTSVALYPMITNSDSLWAKGILSLVAMASAISALVPRVKNYGEQAGTARVLAAQYGSVYGRLLDIIRDHDANQVVDQRAARVVVNEYQSIKEKKDALRGLTDWATKHSLHIHDGRAHRDEDPLGPRDSDAPVSEGRPASATTADTACFPDNLVTKSSKSSSEDVYQDV